jgi:hypothetical protein
MTQFRQQVIEVVLESQPKRERRVREAVGRVMAQHAAQKTLSELERDLPHTLHNVFGQELLGDINKELGPLGLRVTALECIGSVTPPDKAPAAKTVAEVRKKLEALLRPKTPDTSMQQVEASLAALQQRARKAQQEMMSASRAVNAYAQAIIDVLEPLYQKAKPKPDTQHMANTGREKSARMQAAEAEITELMKDLNEIKKLVGQVKRPPFDLTADELATLFKALEDR